MTTNSELRLIANWALVKRKGRYAIVVLGYKDKMADGQMEREACTERDMWKHVSGPYRDWSPLWPEQQHTRQ